MAWKQAYTLDTIQDFLCKLGMKPHMHLLEISIFSLNNRSNGQTYQSYEQGQHKLCTFLENELLKKSFKKFH